MVHLVLDGPGLEPRGLGADLLSHDREALEEDPDSPAHVGVMLGSDRQPSRPTSDPSAATISGFTITSVPWQAVAFGWPVTSTAMTLRDTPIWGADRPTHRSWARMVSSRSRATSRTSSSTPAQAAATDFSIGSG